jgi:hypothetical protein
MASNLVEVREVLSKLDPANDQHWTSQGLPRMDALASLGLLIERRELNEAMPGFTRGSLARQKGTGPAPQVMAAAPISADLDSAKASHSVIVARYERHQRAVEIATKALDEAGLCLADLTSPMRSRLDRNMAARNRLARRSMAS